MIDFSKPAIDIFEILRSFDYEVALFDEDGNICYEPEDARRFFAKPTNMLVSIIDDGDNSSIRLYLSKETNVNQLIGMISTFRLTATKYNLLFNVRKYNKTLDVKDFSTKHSVQETVENIADEIIKESIKIMKEHNKGDQNSFSQTFIDDKIISSKKIHSFADTKNSQEDVYLYVYDSDNVLYFTINVAENEPSSYLLLNHINNNIWQVKGVAIFDKYQLRGIASTMYHYVISTGKKIISDTQLTDAAEAMWKKFPKYGLTLKIYDKVDGQIYPLTAVGQQTNDGTTILDPEQHETYSQGDYSGDNIRFFWLAESINKKIFEGFKSHKVLQQYINGTLRQPHYPIFPTLPRFCDKGSY